MILGVNAVCRGDDPLIIVVEAVDSAFVLLAVALDFVMVVVAFANPVVVDCSALAKVVEETEAALVEFEAIC